MAARAVPALGRLRLLCPAVRAEVACDALLTAHAVPCLRPNRLRLLRAAVRAKIAHDPLLTTRAVPAGHIRRLLHHAAHPLRDWRNSLLRHADDAAHHTQTDAHLHHFAGHTAEAAGSAAVLHGLQPHLAAGFLLIGIALHLHLQRLRLSLHAVCVRLGLRPDALRIRVALRADDLHACDSLRFHALALEGRLGLRLFDLLLAGLEVEVGVLLLHPAEAGVVIRRDDVRHIQLRHGQAVFLQLRIDGLPQGIGNQIHMLVQLQHADVVGLDDLCHAALDAAGNHRAKIAAVDAGAHIG